MTPLCPVRYCVVNSYIFSLTQCYSTNVLQIFSVVTLFLPFGCGFMLFLLLSDCRRKTNCSRQSWQRRDHSYSLRRSWQFGGTRSSNWTGRTRLVGVLNCQLIVGGIVYINVLCFFSFSGGQQRFSDMRDDDSLFSKFFGEFK